MWTVSGTFIREYRKQFLDASGAPKCGYEHTATMLLDALRLAQEGREQEAIDMAWQYGIDLNLVYQDYLIKITRQKNAR